MAYRVFTDSCSDLPKDYVLARALSVIPLRFHIGGKEYLDDFGQSMSCKEFYGKLREGVHLRKSPPEMATPNMRSEAEQIS